MDYRALLEVYSPGEPDGVRVYVGYISHCDKLSVQNPDCTNCTHSTIVQHTPGLTVGEKHWKFKVQRPAQYLNSVVLLFEWCCWRDLSFDIHQTTCCHLLTSVWRGPPCHHSSSCCDLNQNINRLPFVKLHKPSKISNLFLVSPIYFTTFRRRWLWRWWWGK